MKVGDLLQTYQGDLCVVTGTWGTGSIEVYYIVDQRLRTLPVTFGFKRIEKK